MSKIWLLILASVLLLAQTQKVVAATNFSTSYTTSYTVSDTGITHVAVQVALTNITSKYYATSSKTIIGFTDIQNLSVSNSSGKLKPTVTKTQSGNSIAVNFQKPVVGINKTNLLTIAFDTQDVAKHNGNIWEINIPGLKNIAQVNLYAVTVNIPKSFGTPSYTKPFSNILTFSKEQLNTAGISLAYGQKQAYNFSLTYQLSNNTFYSNLKTIALPPNTNYQSVSINSINPMPQNVTQDTDGNWIASYHLLPGESKKITATGTILVTLSPAFQELTQGELIADTRQQPYWQTTDSQIKTSAQELKTPIAIYNYVVSHLQYSFVNAQKNPSRLGAKAALNNPATATSREFTDLFIALSRAAGIPAREINGFAYTTNRQERPVLDAETNLHVWPEYYDMQRRTWIMIDPTWQQTTSGTDYFHTLDFDHVVFAIKGQSSTSPLPPGNDNQLQNDVVMSFAKVSKLPDAKLSYYLNIPAKVYGGLHPTITLYLKNNGPTALINQKIPVTFGASQHVTSQEVSLPPFGSQLIAISLPKTTILTNTTRIVTIQLGQNTITGKVTIVPLFQNPWIIGGSICVLLSIGLLIFAARTRRLSIFRKKR